MPDTRHNIGAYVKQFQANAQATAAGAAIALVAGAAEDGVEVVGTAINRAPVSSQRYDSCSLAVTGLASLTATETLTLEVKYKTSSDGVTFAGETTLQAAVVVATGGGGGTDETFALDLDLDLAPLPQYIQFNITPTMSAGATDIAVWSATATLGGADYLPV